VVNETGSKIAVSVERIISVVDAAVASTKTSQVYHQFIDMHFSPAVAGSRQEASQARLMLFDLEMGGQRALESWEATDVTALSFSPDGDSLVAGYGRRFITALHLRSIKAKRCLVGLLSVYPSVALTPNGESLRSAGDGRIQVYSFASRESYTRKR